MHVLLNVMLSYSYITKYDPIYFGISKGYNILYYTGIVECININITKTYHFYIGFTLRR